MTTSRSRFYVDAPVNRDPSVRHSMFVSQSELDKRPQPFSSPRTSATLPASAGSVDHLTALGKAEKKPPRFFNLRSKSTFSLRPLFTSSRRKSVDATVSRRDSSSQTDGRPARDEVGVQTQNASTVDVPVQTSFHVWEDDSPFSWRLSTPRSTSGLPPSAGYSVKSFHTTVPAASRSPLINYFTAKELPGTVLTAPKPLAASDSSISLYDEPTVDSFNVSAAYNDASAPPLVDNDSSLVTSGLSGIGESGEKSLKPVLVKASSNDLEDPDWTKVAVKLEPSPSPVRLVKDLDNTSTSSLESPDTKILLPECFPSKSKVVQFALAEPDYVKQPVLGVKPRNVDEEFENLLRGLDVFNGSPDEGDFRISLTSFQCESNDKQALSSPKLRSAFDILRQDFLASIPENSEPADSIGTNQLGFFNSTSDPNNSEDDAKLNGIADKGDSNIHPRSSIEVEISRVTPPSLEDRNSSSGITTDSVKTAPQFTPAKSDLNVTYRYEDSVYIYETGNKKETKQPPAKTVPMPTLPSFFEAQPKCGSPEVHTVMHRTCSLPQQVVAQRLSNMSLENEFDGKNKYSRSNSCNSTRSSSVSGYDPFHDDPFKFDSCENLDQLEEEIIRSLYSPLINDSENQDQLNYDGGFRDRSQVQPTDSIRTADATKMRRAILDRLLSGESVEESVPNQSGSTDAQLSEGKCAMGSPQKYTATLTKMEHVKNYVPINDDGDSSHLRMNTCSLALTNNHHSDSQTVIHDPVIPTSQGVSSDFKYPIQQEIESPKKTSIFLFPEVKPLCDYVPDESSVEVHLQVKNPSSLEVRRSSWSVTPADAPTRQTPTNLCDIIENRRDMENSSETTGQCEYINCVKPSQLQNSPFMEELSYRSLTPRPENNTISRTTPTRTEVAAHDKQQVPLVVEKCDYASCLKPSQIQNSVFTAKLSELRTNETSIHPVKCSNSPLPKTAFSQQPTEPNPIDTDTLNWSELQEIVEPEVKIKSEFQITLRTPEKKDVVENIPNSLSEEVQSNSEKNSPPPPPPPPPPAQSSGPLDKSHHNNDVISLETLIRNQHSNLVPSEQKPAPPPRSPMLIELQKRFETRHKSTESQDEKYEKCLGQERNSSPCTLPERNVDVEETSAWKPNSEVKTNGAWKDDSPVNFRNKFQNGTNGTSPDQREQWSSLPNSPNYDFHAGNQDYTNGGAKIPFSSNTIITDEPPPQGAVLLDKKVIVDGDKVHTDKYYAIPIKEVLKEKTSTTTFIPAPPKYEGIGPTEEGVPTGLRNSVKKENMHNWYKTMFKSLHKADSLDDTQEYIIGYTSEPETKKDKITRKKSATLDNRQRHENIKLNNTMLRQDYIPSAKYSNNVYNVRPRLIEDFEPGQSSVTDNDFNTSSKRFLTAVNTPKPSYEFKNGYESDTTMMRKPQQPEGLGPEQQKVWYREIQRGGDIPQFGLGKAAPERPKDPVVGPLPPPPLNYPKQPTYQQATRPQTLPSEYANQNGGSLCQQMNGVYEVHMRQAIHSELQQRMSPSSQQLSPPNRSLVKSPSKSPDMRTPAKALFDFTAESPKEMSLKKGDLVLILRQLDKNWYEGEQNGIVGIFPISYIEIIPPEHMSFPVKCSIEGLGKALFDFQAHTSIELSMRKGDMMTLVRRVDANWYEGRINNKKGIIPVSYIQVLQEPSESNTGSPTAKVYNNSPRSRSESRERVSKTVSNPPSPYSVNSPSPQAVTNCANKFQNRSKKGSSLVEPIPYRAVYSYGPQNSDELELFEGDTVYVVEMCDDGWYVGTSVRTGVCGIFPGNYVEKV